MLSLTRKQGQRIYFILDTGERIELIIGQIRGHSVKVAIEAPQYVKIHRAEIYDAGKVKPRSNDHFDP